MADDGFPRGVLRHADRIQRLRDGADLVDLDENCVCRIQVNGFPQIFDVGHKKIVSHELNPAADRAVQNLPSGPVAFGHAVFHGVNGIFFGQGLDVCRLFCGGEHSALSLFFVFVKPRFRVVEFAGCAVEGDRNIPAGCPCPRLVSGAFD